MCSVLGAYIREVNEDDLHLLKRIFLESKIRGLHATGVSYLMGNEVVTVREPLPADEFLVKHPLLEMVDTDNSLRLIGHCRYSTSDLEFNQPMATRKIGIVHNGVVTQEPYESWKELYPEYKTETRNDTELLLRTLESNKEPIVEWPDASIAACDLSEGSLRFYRNGKRPIYYTVFDRGIFISSTRDILHRSGVGGAAIEADCNAVYRYNLYGNGASIGNLSVEDMNHFIVSKQKDLQHV